VQLQRRQQQQQLAAAAYLAAACFQHLASDQLQVNSSSSSRCSRSINERCQQVLDGALHFHLLLRPRRTRRLHYHLPYQVLGVQRRQQQQQQLLLQQQLSGVLVVV
jgi:uncharacterized CHY-type Zn-finger protein